MTTPISVRICSFCGERYVNPGGHAERCTGGQPVVELARAIVAGNAFADRDAVRVADAYLFAIDDGGAP